MTLRKPWIPPLTLDRNSSGAIANTARIGTAPIGSTQWADIARAQNWLLVGGSMQLGSWGPAVAVAEGASTTLRTYCWPRPQCFARLWTLVMRGASAYGTIETADRMHSFTTNPDLSHTVIHVPELVADTTPTGEAISIVVNNDASSQPLIIYSATCTEIPLNRAAMSGDTTGLGVHETSLEKWRMIAELDETAPSATDQESVAGVMRVASQNASGQHALRRAKIFQWDYPSGLAHSTSTFTNIFRLNPSCQTRFITAGETNRLGRFAAYASCSSGDGEIRVTSSITSDTYTLVITNTTPAWHLSGTFDIATDDTGQDGWVRGSRETLQFDIRAPGSAVTIYNIAVGER